MWFKVDDKLHEHKKVRRLDGDLAALGLWTLCGSWCGATKSDGFIPREIPRRWVASQAKVNNLANKLVTVGLWEPAEVGGETGWRFHDWSACNPLEEEQTDIGRRRWSRKNALSKMPDLRRAVQERDRNLCRYCGVRVNWTDKGKGGATYDHVDPEGGNTLDNLVVACRRCNGRKRDRTPDEAGMPLLPVPKPYVVKESTPESTPSEGDAGSDLATPTRDGAESTPGRLGSARAPGPALTPEGVSA